MTNTVRLKRSATPGKAPQVADLELGEIAINTYDGKVFIKKDDGTEAIVEIGTGGGGTNTEAQVLTTKKLITEDISLDASNNMLSINDVQVDDGVTVTIPAGSTWVVVG